MNKASSNATRRSLHAAAALAVAYGLIFICVGFYVASPRVAAEVQGTSSQSRPQAVPTFVGSSTCVDCHSREHAAWSTSQHAAAMQEATDETVLGPFDGTTFTKDGAETVFFKKDGKFWVRTEGPDGEIAEFEVPYTFGIAPLQQYLISLPNGRMQALGIAWDARPKDEGGQRWFHLYPDQKLTAGHPLHWTGIDQNWNHQCAYCHSTNLKKNYDAATDSFHTTWSEINVGCEACHGPASQHLAWASKKDGWQGAEDKGKGFRSSFDERRGVTWTPSSTGTASRSEERRTNKEIEVCATCHARRGQFSDEKTQRFQDAFRPALLAQGLYHSDGQQRDEVYTHGSFLQSRMHAAGVTCSDCHDPHTQKLRAPANAVCAQCHAPDQFNSPTHHNHRAGSKGAECVSCHMPTTTYMIVDPRHDHSIRIPRPDLTRILGTPNACNKCHTDKTATWAADAIKTWYPSPKLGYQTYAQALHSGDRGEPGAQVLLMRIAKDMSQPAIARASAIARLGRFLSPKSISIVIDALKDPDPVVRVAAIATLAEADPRVRLALLPPLLADDVRIVRMDAARALAGQIEQQLKPEDRKLFDTALDEYIAAQRFNSERPESQVNLANLAIARGQQADAEAALLKAIELDKSFAPAYVALAENRRAQGDEAGAQAALRDGLRQNPESAVLMHALGLSLVRQKRLDEALDKLTEAAKAAPDVPRFAYVAGVALNDTGKPTEAIELLKEALSRNPYDRDLLHLLASYELRDGQYLSALKRAELLQELEPESREVQQFLANVKRAQR